MEAIVDAFAGERRSVPAVQAREQERDEVLEILGAQVDGPTLDRVKAQFRDASASLLDAYTFYAEQQGLATDLLDTFKMGRSLRNRAAHGGTVHVVAQHAFDVRRLLGTILRTELGLAQVVPWEPSSHFLNARIRHHIDFAPTNQEGVHKADDQLLR